MGKRISGSVLLLTTLALSLIVGDVLVLAAQDPQTPPAPSTPQTQTTTKTTTKTRTPKRKRGQMKMTTPMNETTTGDQTTTPPDATTPAQTTPAQTMTPAQMASMGSTQTDLSGTYAGTFVCDPLGLTGDTTLTINGNQFTTADGKTGRIVASTTHGYTAVALQTGDVPTGATTTRAATAAPPTIVSLRARKSGNRLTLMPVSGSTMQCSFTPSRNVARSRRSRQTPPAAGTEVSNPATMPAPTAPAQPVAPPSQTPSPTPSPAPTPEPPPEPSPAPNPTPTPRPAPRGSPTPAPEPTATPSPTPSPSPSPSPRPRG